MSVAFTEPAQHQRRARRIRHVCPDGAVVGLEVEYGRSGRFCAHIYGQGGQYDGYAYGATRALALAHAKEHADSRYRWTADAVSRRIYVASSWKNQYFETVVDLLTGPSENHECYDFKRTSGAAFHWSEAGVNSAGETVENYLAGLNHPRSVAGFHSDFSHMEWADTFVLILPCGRSAHLELGWAVGKGKPTAILLEPGRDVEPPELMYKMVDHIAPDLTSLCDWLYSLGDEGDQQHCTRCVAGSRHRDSSTKERP